MQADGNFAILRTGMVLGALLLLGACSSTGPVATALPQAGSDVPLEQRLQALEAGLRQLEQRVEALQAATGMLAGSAPLASAGNTPAPSGLRPIRPGIVLASHPVRGVPPAKPLAAPEAAPVAERRPAPARQPEPQPSRQGDWVINLASYTSRSYAARKLAEFTAEGVAVEQVRAEVNGGTVYRLRVPGFASYQAASAQAARIRERLGLGDTWVARR